MVKLLKKPGQATPLVFLYGNGQMLPKFEDNLSKLNTGDAFEFTLTSADAYGEMDQDAIIDLDKSIFMIDGKTDDELLTIGNIIPMRDDQGNMLQGTVVSVSNDSVRMDFQSSDGRQYPAFYRESC